MGKQNLDESARKVRKTEVSRMSSDEEIIKDRIERLIPKKLDRFLSLTDYGKDYLFDSWSYDRKGRLCLYYIIHGGYKKRVPMQELIKAVTWHRKERKFDRTDFRRLCPIAFSTGTCGYAVIVRILERIKARALNTGNP